MAIISLITFRKNDRLCSDFNIAYHSFDSISLLPR
jgi:hypothetical protein